MLSDRKSYGINLCLKKIKYIIMNLRKIIASKKYELALDFVFDSHLFESSSVDKFILFYCQDIYHV